MGLGGALGLGSGARDARDAAPLLLWQACHKLTSTVLSRGRHGRRGTTSHLPSFCVAGVVHMALGGALGLDLGARDARDTAPLLLVTR